MGGSSILPQLKKIDKSKKKHIYKLKNSSFKRHRAIDEGVYSEALKTGRSRKQAAQAKKSRFNILRIYRRYENKADCQKITKDMKYMDKKYQLGSTKNIC